MIIIITYRQNGRRWGASETVYRTYRKRWARIVVHITQEVDCVLYLTAGHSLFLPSVDRWPFTRTHGHKPCHNKRDEWVAGRRLCVCVRFFDESQLHRKGRHEELGNRATGTGHFE